MFKRSWCTPTISGANYPFERCCCREWRDWANLPSDLIEKIASRLLRYDVTEHLRFRAGCKAWRTCTADPRTCILEPRFRPRRWIMLSNCDGPRRRFLNLDTGACAHMDLPELSNHILECSTEGLLVLRRNDGSDEIRLLHPFTRSLVEFPSVTAVLKSVRPQEWIAEWNKACPSRILYAAISDKTSQPSVALFLRGILWNVAYARPGDKRWTLVDGKGWQAYPDERKLIDGGDARMIRSIWFASVVTLRGRVYFSTYEGNVLELRLHPRPRLVPVIMDQSRTTLCNNVICYLVLAGRDLLMVRCYLNLTHIEPDERRRMKRRKKTNLFKIPSVERPGWNDWYQLEVWKVDLRGKRLLPAAADSVGQRALFIGDVACVSLLSRRFRSLYGDAVYLGTNSHCARIPCGLCHLDDYRIEPRLELVREGGSRVPRVHSKTVVYPERVVPHARPCSLEEYLLCYVGFRGGIKD